MSDETLLRLAGAAGIQPRWRDVHHQWHDVAPSTLRTVLGALGFHAATDAEVADSEAGMRAASTRLPPLLTAWAGGTVHLPGPGRWRLALEGGGVLDGDALDGTMIAPEQPGYHTLETAGQETRLAVAPRRAWGVADATPGQRPWALAVQLYGLRRPGDGGLGDFAALADLVGAAARHGAAGVAISPVHAQFSADIHRFSPYSPSSRLAVNVLHAAVDVPDDGGGDPDLVDWPRASQRRLLALRAAFATIGDEERAAFQRFRTHDAALETHATFEALHEHLFGLDPSRWHWRTWPDELQNPGNPAVARFAAEHADTVALHAWMQFRADQGLAAAQAAARAAGMGIGLIADLAVGADSGGSHCWSNPAQTLPGMGIGAPPDLLNRDGQGWGIAAFSPSGLRDHGYAAFLDMLRHAMRHAGAVRIDHALGLQRLWVVPDGASPRDGAYITFPMDDVGRLIALESVRNRAIVLGEDLGTVPDGFQDRMESIGILGMRVLWFERGREHFTPARTWSRAAAAMTSTHDLPTVAGWWTGRDLHWRKETGTSGGPGAEATDAAERERDRGVLWSAFAESSAAHGPAPEPADPVPVVDAAVRFLATAACDLVILPIEDALALPEQPNLPGTLDQHPNWRRRYPGTAATVLDAPGVAERLAPLNARAAGEHAS